MGIVVYIVSAVHSAECSSGKHKTSCTDIPKVLGVRAGVGSGAPPPLVYPKPNSFIYVNCARESHVTA